MREWTDQAAIASELEQLHAVRTSHPAACQTAELTNSGTHSLTLTL